MPNTCKIQFKQLAMSNIDYKEEFFNWPVAKCLSTCETDLEKGLTTDEAARRLEIYGINELEQKVPATLFERIKEQFDDLLVKILIAAACISWIIAMFGN